MSHVMVVVCCIDPAVRKPMRRLKERFAPEFAPDFFEIKMVGGAYALVDGVQLHQDALIDQIQRALMASGASEVALINHENCRAQGGSTSFGNVYHERSVNKNRLQEAYWVLRSKLSQDVGIHLVYLPKDGEADILATPRFAPSADDGVGLASAEPALA